MSFSLRHCFTRKTTIGPASRVPGIGKYRLISPPGETPYFASLDTPLLQIGKDIIDTNAPRYGRSDRPGIPSDHSHTDSEAMQVIYRLPRFRTNFVLERQCAKHNRVRDKRHRDV